MFGYYRAFGRGISDGGCKSMDTVLTGISFKVKILRGSLGLPDKLLRGSLGSFKGSSLI